MASAVSDAFVLILLAPYHLRDSLFGIDACCFLGAPGICYEALAPERRNILRNSQRPSR